MNSSYRDLSFCSKEMGFCILCYFYFYDIAEIH